MSYGILMDELKKGATRGLYLFYGPEEYMIKHCAREVEKLIVEPFAKDVSYNLFEGKAELWDIYNACIAYPFFGDKRLVVVRDSGLFRPAAGETARNLSGAAKNKRAAQKRGKDQSRDAAQDPVDAGIHADMSPGYIIDQLPDSTCLLFIETAVDKRTALYKQIAERGLIAEFAYQPTDKLEKWALNIAGKAGTQFTRDALKRFIEIAGESMTEVRSELDKLLMYVSERRRITAEDVAAVCIVPLRVRIFDILDNIAAGRRKQALGQLGAMLGEREPAMRIMSAISSHLILLRQIKALADGGARLPEATKLLGIHSYRAEKLWRQGARVSQDAVAQAIDLCHIQDAAVKSGRIGDIPALQLLVASIKL